MTQAPPPRRKRSRSITITGLMASAALSIGGCEAPAPQARWDSKSTGEVDVATFANPAECTTSGKFTAEECNTAYRDALSESDAKAPQFADQQSCEERYGVAQCVPRSEAGGGTSFMPLLAGFMIGQALSGGGYGYRGAPLYRDRDQYADGGGGGYVTGSGNRVQQDYVNGRTRVRADSFDAPVRAQSRSAVISRSGFGGGGRSYGG